MTYYFTCAQVRPVRIALIVPTLNPRAVATDLFVPPPAIIARAVRTRSSVIFDFPLSSPLTKRTRPASCWKRVLASSVQYLRFDSRLSTVSPLIWSTLNGLGPKNAAATSLWTSHRFGRLYCHRFTTKYPLQRVGGMMRPGLSIQPWPLRTRDGSLRTAPKSLTSYSPSKSGHGRQASFMQKPIPCESMVHNGLADRKVQLAKAKGLLL